jgi:hypothetical protein
MISHKEIYLATESTGSTEFISTQINTVFARLGVLDEPYLLSKLSRRIRLRPPNAFGLHFEPSKRHGFKKGLGE